MKVECMCSTAVMCTTSHLQPLIHAHSFPTLLSTHTESHFPPLLPLAAGGTQMANTKPRLLQSEGKHTQAQSERQTGLCVGKGVGSEQ